VFCSLGSSDAAADDPVAALYLAALPMPPDAPATPPADGRVDFERARWDWYHGRRHINCLDCNKAPWEHYSSDHPCSWVGPTDGPHLDPPCAACGECEHLHLPGHRGAACAGFVVSPAGRADAGSRPVAG